MKRRQSPPNPKHMWRQPTTPLETSERDGNQEATASSNVNLKRAPPAKQHSLSLSQQTQLKATHMQTPNSSTTISPPSLISTFITAYGPKLKVTLDCLPGFGRTKQSFKDDTNINNILARYARTGVLEFANRHEPRYGDVIGADFHAAMNIVANANSMFADLPAKLRNRFDNDPGQFLDFVQDPENTAEAERLGLTVPARAATEAQAASAARALPASHLEDGSATHEPLRARDGTFREHTRKEKRDEARAQKASDDAE